MGQVVDGGQTSVSPPPDELVAKTAAEFARQSEKLSLEKSSGPENPKAAAVRAKFVTPEDAVLVTGDGHRLPSVPLPEAHKLNYLRDELAHEIEDQANDGDGKDKSSARDQRGEDNRATKLPSKVFALEEGDVSQQSADHLQSSMPSLHTNPLFPPLPLYGPPSVLRDLQCWTFRFSSFFLSAAFLGVIVLGALFTSIPTVCNRIWLRFTFRNPDALRPLYEEENRRDSTRKEQERLWKRRRSISRGNDGQECSLSDDGFVPTEGGPDPVVCDVGYYARRVGLDVESFEVQTEEYVFLNSFFRIVAKRSLANPT